MRKFRRQGFASALSVEQRAELDRLLFEENRPYLDVVKFFKERFGIQVSDTTLANYYRRYVCEEAGRAMATAAEASTVRGTGVEVTIRCADPGRILLSIHPLHGAALSPAPATDATTLRAAGLEIAVVCQRPGEIRLAVLPLHEAEQVQPGVHP